MMVLAVTETAQGYVGHLAPVCHKEWITKRRIGWGGGAPFKVQPSGDLLDSSGKKTYLMGAVRDIICLFFFRRCLRLTKLHSEWNKLSASFVNFSICFCEFSTESPARSFSSRAKLGVTS